MKLYSTDGTEMMEVTKIEPEPTRLLVTGTMMGAMPVEIVLTGPEMRKIFPLLSFKIVWTAIRLLFAKAKPDRKE